MMSLLIQYDVIVATVTGMYDAIDIGTGRQYKPCSIIFSVILQAEILSTVTSDCRKQMINSKSFNFVFNTKSHVASDKIISRTYNMKTIGLQSSVANTTEHAGSVDN